MTEPSKSSATPTNVTSLLFKAVKGLPEEEQRVVFEYFFEMGMGTPQAPFIGPFMNQSDSPAGKLERGAWPRSPMFAEPFSAHKPMGPERIMIPVRISTDQHRRLKEWCAEHGFPMAVVVRGLIDRFLDSWEKRVA